jgi:hypothetical protein
MAESSKEEAKEGSHPKRPKFHIIMDNDLK